MNEMFFILFLIYGVIKSVLEYDHIALGIASSLPNGIIFNEIIVNFIVINTCARNKLVSLC